MAESDILAVTSSPQQADSSRQWYQLRCRVTSGPHKLGIFDCKLCKESVLPIGRFRGNPAKGLWLVEDVEVSSKHAELRLQEVTRDLVLRDIGSTNGSFINGNRVPAFTNSTVSIGDEIKLGKTTLYFAKLQPIEYSSDTPRAVVEFTPAEAQTEEGNQLTNRWSMEHPDPGIPNGRPNATDTEADTSEHSRGLYDYSEYDCPHCGKALGAMKPASRIRHVRNCATKSPSKRRKRKAVPKKQQKRPTATTEGRQNVSAKSPLDRPPVLLIEQNEDFISVGPIAPPRLKAKRGQRKKSKKAKRSVTDREPPRDSNTNAGVDPSQEIPVPTKLPSDSEAALGKKQEEAEGEEHSKKSVVAELSSFRFNGMLTAKADVDIHSSMAESATATGRSSHKSSHAEGDDVGQENLEALQSEIAAVDEEIASLRARRAQLWRRLEATRRALVQGKPIPQAPTAKTTKPVPGAKRRKVAAKAAKQKHALESAPNYFQRVGQHGDKLASALFPSQQSAYGNVSSEINASPARHWLQGSNVQRVAHAKSLWAASSGEGTLFDKFVVPSLLDGLECTDFMKAKEVENGRQHQPRARTPPDAQGSEIIHSDTEELVGVDEDTK